MDTDLPHHPQKVTCDCGAQWTVADPFADSLTCGVCGKVIHLQPKGTQRFLTPPPMVIEGAGYHPEHPLSAAVRLVHAQQYELALDAYKAHLATVPHMRDVFYGLGYCYYKLGHLRESKAFLQVAHELGHPHVAPLLQKVERLLHPGS